MLLIIVFVLKPYFAKHDTISAWTGGNGSGKTLASVADALLCLRKNTWKIYWHNFLHPFDKWDKPYLYSSIPIRFKRHFWSKYEWSRELKIEHLTMIEALPPRCVVLMDEIALFLSQMENKFPSRKTIEKFITLFRHLTFGGYLIVNTQNLSKVNCLFRYCLNESKNLFGFNKTPFFPILAWTHCRTVTISEDVKVIEQGNKEDNARLMFFLLFKYIKCYDSYCYSEIYISVPSGSYKNYYKHKIYQILTLNTKIDYQSLELFLD